MQCRRCEHENSSKAKFCEACGTPLSRLHETGSPRASYEDQERALGEALAQQTATAEILHVISRSPTDIQPVLDAVAESATRLCVAYDAIILRLDGDILRPVAHHGRIPSDPGLVMSATSRDTVAGRAVLDRQPIHVADLQAEAEEFPEGSKFARRNGHRSILSVPLLREGIAIGVITIRRTEVLPFTDTQISLLHTFADQAVIALENVRLFTELEARNRDLTATSDILQLIASSPTDLEPVFESIVRSAARVCDATDATLAVAERHEYRISAHYGPIPLRPVGSTFPIGSGTVMGRTILEGKVYHVEDLSTAEAFPQGQRLALELGQRATLCVPLLREGASIGTIMLRRAEAQLFTERQVTLLRTFADQAVIAIENVRLFKELDARNRDLTEALEQQTATGEILRVISGSPTDVQPVFETILDSATRLCVAENGILFQYDDGAFHTVACRGLSPEAETAFRADPMRPGPLSGLGRLLAEQRPVQVADITEDIAYRQGDPLRARTVTLLGARTAMWIPLLKRDTVIGALAIYRRDVHPFTAKQIELVGTFADQAVIAIENVRLFTELQEKNRALTDAHAQVTESLEQQIATSEILRVISSSPTDVQPVFESIAASALRLCDAKLCTTFTFDGELIHLVASHHVTEEGAAAYRDAYPSRPGRASGTHRAILTRTIVHIPDIREDPEYELRALARANDYGCVLAVPMLRDGHPVGAITVGREAARPFPSEQIALLKTFADQAVIAVENVRLFKELEARNRDLTEALEQQTATAEILRVISSSPTDVQPVFDTIVRSAVRLCNGLFCSLLRFDGELIYNVAQHNYTPEALEEVHRIYPTRPTRALPSGRAILERAVVHIPDVEVDPDFQNGSLSRAIGWRSGLFVPMLRTGAAIGAIAVTRAARGPFSDNEIELLKTFADQAVIAIENVRLFKELEARNRDLTEALDQQTATAEILRVISQSQTDVQPVFDAILGSAVRLLGAYSGVLTRIAGDQIVLAALTSSDDAGDAATRALFPQSLQSELSKAGQWDKMAAGYAQTIRERAPLNIADAHTDPRWPEAARAYARVRGYRSWVAVPMLRHDGPIGTISVTRREPGGFTDDEIALLKTFADQAVIAIENARLLTELQARTQELSRSVGELQALGEVGQAISSTLDLETVLTTIVSRAVQLSALDGGVVFEYDEGTEEFVQRAGTDPGGALAEARRTTRIRKGEGVLGRTAITLEPIQVPDITVPAAYEGRLREILVESGVRAILAVPMVREGRLIGCLGVTRNQPGEFPAETIELLRTFATQSALAIQNARLFHEIEDKSRQLEAASRHKSEFLANMSHELRTPLNAVIGFSEVLIQRMFGDLNDKQEEYLKDIYASGQHLLSLINDILDLSKIEAGRMELAPAPFHLPSALENAVTLVKERAARHGIALELDIDPRLGEFVGDERKIKQVLLNLLSNAVKFTPEGGRITLKARRAHGTVEVAVTDTGIGIAPEDQAAIFEEFRQVGSDETRKQEGTGLGLTLAKKFVELHGGRIWVESEVGRGSTFTFTLPVS